MWRRYMEYFIVEKHKDCIEYLKEYNAVGCQVSTDKMPFCRNWCFVGNFWWSKSEYIKKLSPISSLRKHNRMKAEKWVLSYKDKKVKSLFEVNRRLIDFPPEENEYKK